MSPLSSHNIQEVLDGLAQNSQIGEEVYLRLSAMNQQEFRQQRQPQEQPQTRQRRGVPPSLSGTEDDNESNTDEEENDDGDADPAPRVCQHCVETDGIVYSLLRVMADREGRYQSVLRRIRHFLREVMATA